MQNKRFVFLWSDLKKKNQLCSFFVGNVVLIWAKIRISVRVAKGIYEDLEFSNEIEMIWLAKISLYCIWNSCNCNTSFTSEETFRSSFQATIFPEPTCFLLLVEALVYSF